MKDVHWTSPELALLEYLGMSLGSLDLRSKHGDALCIEPLEGRKEQVQGVHGSGGVGQAWCQLLCGCIGLEVGQLHDVFLMCLEGHGQTEPG